MRIEVTTKVEDIRKVLCHPEIYECITADGDPTADEWTVPFNGVEYIGGYVNNEIFAVMIYHGDQSKLNCHIQVLPEYRRDFARQFAQQALDMGKAKNIPIFAEIPDCYPNVLRFAKSFGFEVIHKLKDNYTKNGVKSDLNILRCAS